MLLEFSKGWFEEGFNLGLIGGVEEGVVIKAGGGCQKLPDGCLDEDIIAGAVLLRFKL